jgi:hypothetical protein
MRLVDKLHKHPPFDCASGMASALLATGTVEVYKEPEKPISHVIKFVAREGAVVDDGRLPPEIHWHCSICGPGQFQGPNSHKQNVYHHPPKGFVQEVPSDVAVAFIKLRKDWERRR